MAIDYVGGITGSGTNATYNLSLTGLSGGVESTAREGDLVLVTTSYVSTVAKSTNVSTSGFGVLAAVTASDSTSISFITSYKVLTSTPDTLVTVEASPSSAIISSTTVAVWRNADRLSPIDVTTATATGTNSGYPTNPNITPVSTGAVIVAFAGAGTGSTANTRFGAAPYGTKISLTANSGTAYAQTAYTSKTWSGGADGGGTWGWSGSDSSGHSWAAITVAINPQILFTISETLSLSETSIVGKRFGTLVEETLSLTEVGSFLRTLASNILETLSLKEYLNVSKWINQDKGQDTWIGQSKESITFTNQSKTPDIWVELDK